MLDGDKEKENGYYLFIKTGTSTGSQESDVFENLMKHLSSCIFNLFKRRTDRKFSEIRCVRKLCW